MGLIDVLVVGCCAVAVATLTETGRCRRQTVCVCVILGQTRSRGHDTTVELIIHASFSVFLYSESGKVIFLRICEAVLFRAALTRLKVIPNQTRGRSSLTCSAVCKGLRCLLTGKSVEDCDENSGRA